MRNNVFGVSFLAFILCSLFGMAAEEAINGGLVGQLIKKGYNSRPGCILCTSIRYTKNFKVMCQVVAEAPTPENMRQTAMPTSSVPYNCTPVC